MSLPNHFVPLVDVPVRDVPLPEADDTKQPFHHSMDSSSTEMSSSFHSPNKFNVLNENGECPDQVTTKQNTKVTETKGEARRGTNQKKKNSVENVTHEIKHARAKCDLKCC